MPKIDFIVGTAIVVYFATAITEVVSSVTVGLTQSDFSGNCILSASTNYENSTFFITSYGNKGACGFCTYLTIFTILYALLYGSYSAYALYNNVENASQMWVLPAMMACALFLVLKFISSCILSAGYSQFCKSVSRESDLSCQKAQNKPWVYNGDTQDGTKYNTYMTTAQSASWFCVFEWTILLVLAFLHYRRNIALRSSGSALDAVEGFGSADTAGIVANEILPGKD